MELNGQALKVDQIYCGDAKRLLNFVQPDSIALSIWSPPYYVGKSYERDLTFESWKALLQIVISKHFRILKPGAFLAINIADILCFPDPSLPKIMAENTNSGNRCAVSRDDVLRVLQKHPNYNRYQIAEALGVSEQTVDRRMKNNNIRGGKYAIQTRVQLVGDILDVFARQAGFSLYDRRVWAKDPCWENSKWHTNSYRAVDEFEYVYIFWKPGITKVDRNRLSRKEWSEWGSRAVWHIASVRANDNHEAKFPVELPRRAIKLLTDPGDVVLDCFLGSGTTAVAAIMENRHYIGIEKVPDYAKLARRACKTILPMNQGPSPHSAAKKYAEHANGTGSANAKNLALF